jgi:hypothetical protein
MFNFFKLKTPQFVIILRGFAFLLFYFFLGYLTAACAAASLASGTLNGEHDTYVNPIL